MIRRKAILPVSILVVGLGLFLTPLSNGITEAAGSHFYAQATKSGTFYGVWATIETATPKLREQLFSYSSINIIGSSGKWVEAGWIKLQSQGCVPKFSWAIQPGNANIISNPSPTVGVAYQYIIYRISSGNWKLQIANTSGLVLVDINISNPGMNYGTQIQAVGEVDSPNKLNDMGVSGLLSLKWRNSSSIWYYWNGWTKGVEDNPPYHVVGVTGDPNNNVQVYGNNGNPVPPGAPCP
jgi:hypothetical protein